MTKKRGTQMPSGQAKFMLNRRSFLEGALALGAASTIFDPRTLSAAEAAELRVLFPGGSLQDWFTQVFTGPFSRETGAKIVFKTGNTLNPIVLAQKTRPQWDIIHLSQTEAGQLGAMGAVAPLMEDRIPNIKKIHPAFRYPHLVGKMHTPYGMVVNTKRVKREITSWFDMWDPAFAGKVAWPHWEWVGQELFYAINTIEGGTEENIDPGINKMAELFKTNRPQVLDNNEQMKQLLVSEDVWIAPLFAARTQKAKEAGAPVEWILPKEGMISWVWNTALIANRPDQSTALAEHFINETLDAERQIEFARLTGYPPTNMEAMANLPPDLKHLEISSAAADDLGKLQRKFDFMAQFAYRDQNRERWDREVIGA